MKKHLSIIFAAMVALFVVAAAPTQVTAATDYPEFGATYHGFWNYASAAERDEALTKLQAAGGEWVRIDVGWATVEETQDVYSDWSLSRYDTVIQEASDKGLKVVLTVQNTPDWAHDSDDVRVAPDNPNELGEFLKDMSLRYSGQIDAIEVWNEPNNPDFFEATTPGQEAEEFYAMVATSYDWVKNEGDSSVTVFAGGSVYVDDEWWSELYALGIKDVTDVIAVNPYMAVADESPLEPDNGTKWRLQHMPALLQVMADNGDSDKPIWFTEFGWSSHEPYSANNWEQPVTEEEQADFLEQTLNLVRDSYPQVQNAFWYNLRDRGTDEVHINNFGLLRNDFSEKPVYARAQSLLVAAPTTPDQDADEDQATGGAAVDADAAENSATGEAQASTGELADTGTSAVLASLGSLTAIIIGIITLRRL